MLVVKLAAHLATLVRSATPSKGALIIFFFFFPESGFAQKHNEEVFVNIKRLKLYSNFEGLIIYLPFCLCVVMYYYNYIIKSWASQAGCCPSLPDGCTGHSRILDTPLGV